MKIPSDIAELLRAGLPNHVIGSQLHISPTIVQQTRVALGIPNLKSIPPADSVEDMFHKRTEPAPGGHLLWVGRVSRTGQLTVGWRGRDYSPHTIAFRIRTGRDPVGRAKTACGTRHCVAPAHVDDALERARDNTTFNALFGGTA